MRSGLIGGLVLVASAHAVDVLDFVDLFIGTASGANGGSGGNAFPGAAIPHGMAKVGIDVDTAPRQAGYIADNSSITGISLMHDEGTGGNTNGGYGIFPLFPLSSCTYTSCPAALDVRKVKRAAGVDHAKPGYFTTAFTNGIKIETTSTRRAGLTRLIYPAGANSTHLVVDLANDLQRSFEGGSLSIDGTKGRVQLSGTYLQSYGPDNYTAHACYDLLPPSSSQTIITYGTYASVNSSTPNILNIIPNATTLSYPYSTSPQRIQAGALFEFMPAEEGETTVLVRFGVSMRSSAQACANAEAEVLDWDFDAVRSASETAWRTVLGSVKTDLDAEDPTVLELLYSSLYRANLVPANLTGENPYWEGSEPFYDALFCSWDTFRTAQPLISLLQPLAWAEIVRSYVDGWRHTGYIPECRANTKAGYVQGGSNGMPILGDFASKYGSQTTSLGVNVDDLYQALVDTAENAPPDWYRVGRQNTAWKQFGYIPTNWTDPTGSTGLPTREASRALEYALGDFAVRQAALALSKSVADVEKYENRSMNFLNHWDSNVTHGGFSGFMQRRYPNGTFAFSSPDACSPVDPVGHSCARGNDNDVGFYESSSWEYSFFAPHSMASLIDLMGGPSTFISRLDHYFSEGYFYAGNEPSFETPWLYHYANRPDLSARRIREVVYDNFNTGIGGIPGNDDSGAMAALLVFHLLGLYPVPSSTHLLLGSPLLASYTLTNAALGTSTTVRVENFDSATLVASPPAGSRLFVQSVSVKGEVKSGVCWIGFKDVLGGGEVIITVGAEPREDGCGEGGLPESLNTGGFA